MQVLKDVLMADGSFVKTESKISSCDELTYACIFV